MNHLNSIPALYWLAFSFLCSLLTYAFASSSAYWRGWRDRGKDPDCPPAYAKIPDDPFAK
jgi:hypothetical protein